MVATQFTGEDMVTTVDDSIVVRVSITSSPSSGSKSFSSPPPLTPQSHHYYADDMYRRQLSPENIRVISQRKLSARKCSLLRALLIQNALPHLETDESEEEKMKDEEAALLAQEARDAGFILNFDEKSHSCRSEPEDKQEEEEEEEEKNCEELAIILDASTGRDLDVEEPELVDACYTAAMEALGEIRDSDIIAADAADAACAGRLDMEPVSIIDCSGSDGGGGGGGGENDVTSTSATAAITTPTLTTAMTISAAAALSLLTTKNTSAAAVPIKRKRLPTDCDEDLSIKVVAKQARSSSPCGLTERVRSTSSSPSCPTRPVFSVIQC